MDYSRADYSRANCSRANYSRADRNRSRLDMEVGSRGRSNSGSSGGSSGGNNNSYSLGYGLWKVCKRLSGPFLFFILYRVKKAVD